MRYGMTIDLNRCIGCGACVVACKQEHGTAKDTYWCNVYQKETGTYPNSQLHVLPMGCQHCKNAPCVTTCPTGASYKRDDGIVLVDSGKCIGCRVCVSACPYGARHFNFQDASENPNWGEAFGLTPFEQVKSLSHKKGTAEKCKFCEERLHAGKLPACVTACVVKARAFGDLDDEGSDVSKRIREGNGRPLYEELGTDPSVFYIGAF